MYFKKKSWFTLNTLLNVYLNYKSSNFFVCCLFILVIFFCAVFHTVNHKEYISYVTDMAEFFFGPQNGLKDVSKPFLTLIFKAVMTF